MDNRAIRVYNWKYHLARNPGGYYDLRTEDTGDVPVRLFFSESLLAEAEDGLYQQIVNAKAQNPPSRVETGCHNPRRRVLCSFSRGFNRRGDATA